MGKSVWIYSAKCDYILISWQLTWMQLNTGEHQHLTPLDGMRYEGRAIYFVGGCHPSKMLNDTGKTWCFTMCNTQHCRSDFSQVLVNNMATTKKLLLTPVFVSPKNCGLLSATTRLGGPTLWVTGSGISATRQKRAPFGNQPWLGNPRTKWKSKVQSWEDFFQSQAIVRTNHQTMILQLIMVNNYLNHYLNHIYIGNQSVDQKSIRFQPRSSR